MSEIKFACPHCSQHIACEDICCGESIDCPGCGREMFVPRQAAFIPLQEGKITVALPVASKERQYPRSAALDLWSEEEWERHASKMEVHQHPNLLPLWVFLLLPFFSAFILIRYRMGAVAVGIGFVLCALASGFYLAKIQQKPGVRMILMGGLYSFAALGVYVAMSFGLLFVGCLVAVM